MLAFCKFFFLWHILEEDLYFESSNKFLFPCECKAITKSNLLFKVKLYIDKASGSLSGFNPTKSRGAGPSKSLFVFFFFAFSHPAGNCKFKSVPVIFDFQPRGKGILLNFLIFLMHFYMTDILYLKI